MSSGRPRTLRDPFDLATVGGAPREKPATREWAVPAGLFAATLFSVLLVGGTKAGSPWTFLDLPQLLAHPTRLAAHLGRGVPFAAAMLGILVAHELGHFVTARWHRVDASLPYFIPFPSLLGTMGAVIRLKGVLPTRAALVDVGASGPIAGFVVALPLLFYGYASSTVEPLPSWAPPPQSLVGIVRAALSGEPVGGPIAGILVAGPSLLAALAERVTLGEIPPGFHVNLHPVGWAAWFGLFVTALNLIPVGQLDGGHVAYALLGPRARTLGRAFIVVLAVMGLFTWPGWLLWALLAWKVIRTTHPPVERPEEPLDGLRRAVAWSALAMLVLTFAPMPIAMF